MLVSLVFVYSSYLENDSEINCNTFPCENVFLNKQISLLENDCLIKYENIAQDQHCDFESIISNNDSEINYELIRINDNILTTNGIITLMTDQKIDDLSQNNILLGNYTYDVINDRFIFSEEDNSNFCNDHLSQTNTKYPMDSIVEENEGIKYCEYNLKDFVNLLNLYQADFCQHFSSHEKNLKAVSSKKGKKTKFTKHSLLRLKTLKENILRVSKSLYSLYSDTITLMSTELQEKKINFSVKKINIILDFLSFVFSKFDCKIMKNKNLNLFPELHLLYNILFQYKLEGIFKKIPIIDLIKILSREAKIVMKKQKKINVVLKKNIVSLKRKISYIEKRIQNYNADIYEMNKILMDALDN